MHDAGVMARIPGSSVMVISHHDGEPESAVQASRYDFPSDNPLAGAASESGPASPRPPRPRRTKRPPEPVNATLHLDSVLRHTALWDWAG